LHNVPVGNHHPDRAGEGVPAVVKVKTGSDPGTFPIRERDAVRAVMCGEELYLFLHGEVDDFGLHAGDGTPEVNRMSNRITAQSNRRSLHHGSTQTPLAASSSPYAGCNPWAQAEQVETLYGGPWFQPR
jgi:hypothetical protein